MGFCNYGEQKNIGGGVYYVCSLSGMPCKFARWCSSEKIYKPNANFNSCALRINKRNESIQQPQEVKDEIKTTKRGRKKKDIESVVTSDDDN